MSGRRMRWLAAGAALTLGCGIMAGCGAGEQVPPELAVLDHTGSSTAGSTELCARHLSDYARERYVSVTGKRGELRVDLFDAATDSEPTFPVRESFDVPATDRSNPKRTKKDLEQRLSDLDTAIAHHLQEAGPSHGGTDVVTMLTSLGEAARAVHAKRVWICSDFADNRLPNPLTRAGALAVLRTVRSQGALPDLHGLDVILDTSSTRGRIDVTAAELSALSLFAHQLVKDAGGTMLSYGPGAEVSD